ncbi:plasma membrane snare protein-like protein [Geopyxis carbonaria]|nr:plasma membrane snare protein-like protein [Geopyxis carbonaria]
MGLFSKKDKSAAPEEDHNRNALFGGRKAASPAPGSSQNPYSAPANPYGAPPSGGAAKGGYGAQQPADNSNALFGDRKREQAYSGGRGAQQGGYGAPPQRGGYGNSGGYGRGEEDNGPPPPAYGAPAGGAPSRGGYGGGGQGGYGQSQGGAGGAGGYGQSGYGQGYDKSDRALTQEEEEEEDVDAVKQQIRFTKQESVSSTRNALRVAAQAEEQGRNTLARLGQQGERLYNTEKNLDIAAQHNRTAEEKARELKTLNGSMFAIHMKNPMKSKSRAQMEEQKILDNHQFEREERDRNRKTGYESRQNIDNALGGRGGYRPSATTGRTKASLAERSKYQFEGDEEDDEMENEIDANLDQLGGVAGRLKALAIATGQETDRQNAKIDQIMKKSDDVDDRITVTHNRIKKIH